MPAVWEKVVKKLDDSDVDVQIKALRLLGEMKESGAIPDISRILTKDSDDQVKVEAVIAIGRIGDSEAGESVLPFLDSDDIPLLMETINTLGILIANGFNNGIEGLEKQLEHTNYRVRKFAIEALGRAGSATSIGPLFEHFQKEDIAIDTKEAVTNAIGKIGGPKAMSLLKELIYPGEDVNELAMEVRRAAIHALGESRNTEALELLGKVYNNKDEHKMIRKYAEDAINKTIEGAKNQFMNIKARAKDILKGK